MELPNKKLFSAVMGDGYEIDHIGKIEHPIIDDMDGSVLLHFWYRNEHGSHKRYINLFQFMNMTKVWALGLGFSLCSHFYIDTAFCRFRENNISFEADTEFEAVIKAAHYLLEQQE